MNTEAEISFAALPPALPKRMTAKVAWDVKPQKPQNTARNRLRLYGLTLEQTQAMLRRQKFKCAICPQSFRRTKFVVDHCHAYHHVRGLLCHNCNVGLGLFKDEPKRLIAAIRYLRANRQPRI